MSEKCRRSVTETSDLLKEQRLVFQKSRNYTGLFQMLQLPLYLRNAKVLCYQTSQSPWFILRPEHVKRSACKHKGIAV